MTSKAIISILLLVAIFIPFLTVPNANSQSGAAFTVVTVNTPPPHQCALLPLAFSAQKGQLIQGYFTADVTVDLYVLSQNDFNAFVQGNTCSLPQSAYPLFMHTANRRIEQSVQRCHPDQRDILLPLRLPKQRLISDHQRLRNDRSELSSVHNTHTSFHKHNRNNLHNDTNSSMLSVNTATPEFPVWSIAITLTLSIILVALMIRRERK